MEKNYSIILFNILISQKKIPKGKINNKNKGKEYKKKDLIFLKKKN